MNDHQPGFTEFFQTLGRPVVFYPSLAHMLHSVNAAVMLAQLLYWTPRASDDADGWVYKSADEWTRETSLSYKEQRKARQRLVRLRVMEERNDRLNHRLYFRVNAKILNDLTAIWFAAYPPEGGTCPKVISGNAQREVREVTSGQVASAQRAVRTTRDDARDDGREGNPTPTPPRKRGGRVPKAERMETARRRRILALPDWKTDAEVNEAYRQKFEP
jgi:hypothetical protein